MMFARNEANNAIAEIKDKLNKLSHTNVLLCNIPHRYDLIEQSCVNREITRVNTVMQNLCYEYKNVTIVEISNLKRNLHTRHGMHTNKLGKQHISKLICEIVTNAQDAFLK